MYRLVNLVTHLGVVSVLLLSCAGPNPNPGERTTDTYWLSGKFDQALLKVKPHAERGEPWAQLRLGIFYENGWGVDKDAHKAAEWYQKAMIQKASGDWAEGAMLGAFGKAGYFNQNSDAWIAEFNLAQLYYKGQGIDRDLVQAYVHVSNVINESGGKAIFFCCEFADSRYFTPAQFEQLRTKIRAEITPDQLSQAEQLLSVPQDTTLRPTP